MFADDDPLRPADIGNTDNTNENEEDENSDGLAEWRRSLREKHKFYTPRAVLTIFIFLQLFTFIDRGCFSGALTAIREDPRINGHFYDSAASSGSNSTNSKNGEVLSTTQSGLVTAMFMFSFTFAAPTFSWLGGYFSSRSILVFGNIAWTISVVLTAVSPNFGVLILARALDGLGEAASAPFAVTIIDSIAPRKSKVLWIGLFMSQIAVGTAVGMAYGGIFSAKVSLGDSRENMLASGWRLSFLLLSIPGVVLTVLLAGIPNDYSVHAHDDDDNAAAVTAVDDTNSNSPKKKLSKTNKNDNKFDDAEDRSSSESMLGNTSSLDGVVASPASSSVKSAATAHVPASVAIPRLLGSLDFMVLSISTAAYDFILSGVAAWIIASLRQGPFEVSAAAGALGVGGIMAVSGLFGTVLGGIVVDYFGGGTQGAEGTYKSTAVVSVMTLLSAPVAIIALLSESAGLFFACLLMGVFTLLGTHPAITNAVLKIVEPELRTWSMSINLLFMHIGGDGPAPLVVGAISEGFSGRCGQAKNQTACLQLPSNFFSNISTMNNSLPFDSPDGCRWVVADEAGSSSFCAYKWQINYALLISLSMYLVMLPALVFVSWRQRAKFLREQNPENGGIPDEGEVIDVAGRRGTEMSAVKNSVYDATANSPPIATAVTRVAGEDAMDA